VTLPDMTYAEAIKQTLVLSVHLCIPEDQMVHAPKRRRAPHTLPEGAPLPRVGDFIYLASTSAWVVRRVVHDWRSPCELKIEVWLDWMGNARYARHVDFALTQ